MFLRFTYIYFPSEKRAEAKDIYMTEILPVIRMQKGNKQVLLPEPADGNDEFISYSLWEDESDIKKFEASTDYVAVIDRVKEIVSKPPLQKYYLVNS
ncbi:MAG: antibiotic biosynthesis monooxygenase [Ginsengibacter sp.]